jgi:IS5 family transposase
MKQISFSDIEFAAKKKTTRREFFLGNMEKVIPWSALLEALKPYYYPEHQKRRGRPPIGLEKMLRMYFVQQWYNLADEALEDAVYDSQALRQFIGIDLGKESVPDATTLLKFRHLLERHELTKTIFSTINKMLSEKGYLLSQGTIVDATIIAAPSSTKNVTKERDKEMHSTRKGNQWYFGMKAHIGVDVDSGLVHTVVGTAAHVADVTQIENLLHHKEQVVYGDSGYTGAHKRDAVKEKSVTWRVALKRNCVDNMVDETLKNVARHVEHLKARIRARVEHPFHIIKNIFGYRKVAYKGLAKNTARLYVLFALANLTIIKNF